ncbi:MAG: hypothetical protein COS76_03745 [Candidatus Portnoybacteria bacterium CG06_land_8_20_14_3_00_39_12]|uniref:Uncharacterized protein n=1 Tax=Candidatus Portnoybacteria bacterium CG06_land_8_20_14_3_00_39_12 TaxID=1974809 RepID=A0A2M7AWE8_9BACT|nr:MAG: hypothetical protein COS76_03745 [Candidatus Portnoybacteria bacterium CG06_land_8_20_14_3_00_39_12]
MHIKQYLLIITSIIISVILVTTLSPLVFLSNTPQLRPEFRQTIAKLPSTIRDSINRISGDRIFAKSLEEKLKNEPLIQIAEATYAKSSPDAGAITYFDFKNMKITVHWVLTKKGNRIPILTPEGQTPSESLKQEMIDKY